MDGIVVVDKPAGLTSHDVVARVRRLARTRKVGHAGTLDPMATGVLVVGINRATRLLGHLMLTEKTYAATIRLGSSTTTDDAHGESLGSSDASHLGRSEIENAIARFTGEIEQVPSSVSAIKVDGVRAYARVRAGEQVALESRSVRVDRFDVTDVRTVDDAVDVDVVVECSSGTYIRALARDLGFVLAVGGYLTVLRRTRVGPFDLTQARGLDALAAEFSTLPITQAARLAFPAYELSAEESAAVRFGRPLPETDLGAPGPVAVFADTGEFLALYEPADTGAKPVAVFV